MGIAKEELKRMGKDVAEVAVDAFDNAGDAYVHIFLGVPRLPLPRHTPEADVSDISEDPGPKIQPEPERGMDLDR